ELAEARVKVVIEGELIVEGAVLHAEVIVVELDQDADGLVEIAACADLKLPAWRCIIMRSTSRQSEASADHEGVFVRAVRVGVTVAVVWAAISTARRRLGSFSAEAEVLRRRTGVSRT